MDVLLQIVGDPRTDDRLIGSSDSCSAPSPPVQVSTTTSWTSTECRTSC